MQTEDTRVLTPSAAMGPGAGGGPRGHDAGAGTWDHPDRGAASGRAGVLARSWPRAAERLLFSEAEGLPGSFSHCNLLSLCSPFLRSLQDRPWRRNQATVVLGGIILPLRPVSRAWGAADETPRSGGPASQSFLSPI